MIPTQANVLAAVAMLDGAPVQAHFVRGCINSSAQEVMTPVSRQAMPSKQTAYALYRPFLGLGLGVFSLRNYDLFPHVSRTTAGDYEAIPSGRPAAAPGRRAAPEPSAPPTAAELLKHLNQE